MKMTRLLTVLALGTLLPVSASAAPANQGPAPRAQVAGSYQVAQVCGYFAISACHRSWRAARRSANRYGGFVIDSSNPNYPNFRPGWYCSAIGPVPRWRAFRIRNRMRANGAYSAYVKSSC